VDLERLIRQAQAGDLAAFTEVVRRFQHMAFGSALSLVRDLPQAEDVVQEAFVAAWFGLPSLAEPAAFPGWLRGIVRHQAHRVLRRRHLEALPIQVAEGVADADPTPDRHVEGRREAAAVIAAIAGLPAALREVVTLYYVHECSQQDIATFLGLPVTTVNNRLHAGRVRLKRRMLAMVKETFEAHRLPDDFGGRIGRIVRARERVVEASFAPDALPEVLAELAVSDEAGRRSIAAQVVQRRGDGLVRAVAVSPVDRIEPGMAVLSAGRLAREPVSREGFDRVVQSLAGNPSAPAVIPKLLETGIKVIDVMSPLVAGGTVAIAGEYRAGAMVLSEELVRRLAAGPDGVSVFTFVTPPTGSLLEMWREEGHSGGTVGAVQTFFFLREEGAWTPEGLAALSGVDAVVHLATTLAQRKIYPPVNPLASRSRVHAGGGEHAELADRVRAALRPLLERAANDPPADPVLLARAEKLLRFFGQPFFVAEPYTRRPGVSVPMAESLRGCRDILDGRHDDLPAEAFDFDRGIDEIVARARRP
jgi:RNA polymerase sigma factor (sigma-70 family)